MQQADAKILFEKYQSGQCSPEEQAIVENWLTFGEATKLNLSEQQLDNDLVELRYRVLLIPVKQIKLWPAVLRITGIAAAVAAIVFGIWFFSMHYWSGSYPEFSSGSQYTNDIIPGKSTATLTLANGKTINLSDAKTGVVVGANKLSYSDGSKVEGNLSPSGRDGVAREGSTNNNPLSPQGGSLPEGERSKVQMLRATTPRGGTYQVTLADGTKVWLNADSRIDFPSWFSGKERKILLSGEAYFEVTRDKKHPFIVETDKQKVEVLGTHFNINSYDDEDATKTTLLEGSVRVVSLSASQIVNRKPNIVTLLPNQQSVLNRNNNKIQLIEVDTELAVAWKNGLFYYKNTPMQTVMQQISRWYDVDIEYADPEIKSQTFSGSVSRYDEVSKLLKAIEFIEAAKFKIEGRKIIVLKYQ